MNDFRRHDGLRAIVMSGAVARQVGRTSRGLVNDQPPYLGEMTTRSDATYGSGVPIGNGRVGLYLHLTPLRRGLFIWATAWRVRKPRPLRAGSGFYPGL